MGKLRDAYEAGRYPEKQVPATELDYLRWIAENTYSTRKSVGTIATLAVLALVLSVLGACASFML